MSPAPCSSRNFTSIFFVSVFAFPFAGGGIFCGPCSDQTASLPDLGHSKPQRVCANCFHVICEVRKQGLMLSGAGAGLGLNVGGVPLSAE